MQEYPIYGIQIAFRDYKANRGMFGSEWVGFEWFRRFFSSPNCSYPFSFLFYLTRIHKRGYPINFSVSIACICETLFHLLTIT